MAPRSQHSASVETEKRLRFKASSCVHKEARSVAVIDLSTGEMLGGSSMATPLALKSRLNPVK